MIFTPREPLELADQLRGVAWRPAWRTSPATAMTEPPRSVHLRDRRTAGGRGVRAGRRRRPTSPLEAPIEVRFSTLMDTASVEAALRLRPDVPARAPLERRAARDRADRAAAAGGGLHGRRSARTRSTSPASRWAEPFHDRLQDGRAGLLERSLLVPSDGTDGIAPTSPIAVIFDRPIDPGFAVRRRADPDARPSPARSSWSTSSATRRSHPRTAGSCASRPPVRCRPTRPSRWCWRRASPASSGGGLAEPDLVDLHHRRAARDALQPDHLPHRSRRHPQPVGDERGWHCGTSALDRADPGPRLRRIARRQLASWSATVVA